VRKTKESAITPARAATSVMMISRAMNPEDDHTRLVTPFPFSHARSGAFVEKVASAAWWHIPK
jgi:hypothetical protein